MKPAPRPIDTARIWHELYPADHHFDVEGRVERTILRRGKTLVLRTAIGSIIPYSDGHMSKVLVVLHSYEMKNGKTQDCKVCFPEMDLAFFNWETGNWQKIRFEQNWEGANGAWGKPATVSIDSGLGQKMLVIKSFKGTERDSPVIQTYSLKTLRVPPGVTSSYLE